RPAASKSAKVGSTPTRSINRRSTMTMIRTALYCTALFFVLSLVLSPPNWFWHLVQAHLEARQTRRINDGVRKATKPDMDSFLARKKGKPYEQWPEFDKRVYQAMRDMLQAAGETYPEVPD